MLFSASSDSEITASQLAANGIAVASRNSSGNQHGVTTSGEGTRVHHTAGAHGTGGTDRVARTHTLGKCRIKNRGVGLATPGTGTNAGDGTSVDGTGGGDGGSHAATLQGQ